MKRHAVPGWTELPDGAVAPSPRVDPQLAWALATQFDAYRQGGEPLPGRVTVVIELDFPESIVQLRAALAERDCIREAGLGGASCFFTAEVGIEQCRELAASPGGRYDFVRRLDLGMPVIPGRPRALRPPGPPARAPVPRPAAPRQTGRVLIGVIDDGCPFAHRNLRRADGGTRVLRLWDQDPRPAFGQAPAHGRVPAGLGYGRELLRPELEALMQLVRRNGSIDEAECYAAAGYDVMSGFLTHGSAVLDLFAGRRALRDRLAHAGGEPPAWEGSSANAAVADVVFVQIPRAAVQDTSSAALQAYVLDGLRYIAACAEAADRIVLNVSDGTSRGSHDGHSIVEQAMVELVALQRKAGRELDIVLAAGNNRLERRHGCLAIVPRPTESLVLRLPPDCEMPAFVQVSLPPGSEGAAIVVEPPCGAGSSGPVTAGRLRTWRDADGAICSVAHAAGAPGRRGLALIAFAPTLVQGHGACAPAGDWRLSVTAPRRGAGEAHFYVSRNDLNIGTLARAHQARFVGTGTPVEAGARAIDDDPRSAVRQSATLNGLACVAAPGVHVVGGQRAFDGKPAPYSSLGPALAAGRTAPRPEPDDTAPTDVSPWLPGVPAGGTRSGVRVRVVGTSFAAPQVARDLADRP